MTTADRYRGALVGLSVGDALGTTVEFHPPGSFKPLTGIVGGGPFDLEPGQWTDDTSMALCLAESLIEKQGFDPVDQLERYVRWSRTGHLSSTGRCFDIGGTTSGALYRFEQTHEPYCGSEIGPSEKRAYDRTRSRIRLDPDDEPPHYASTVRLYGRPLSPCRS